MKSGASLYLLRIREAGYRRRPIAGGHSFIKSLSGIADERVDTDREFLPPIAMLPPTALEVSLWGTPWENIDFRSRKFTYDDKAFKKLIAKLRFIVRVLQKGKPAFRDPSIYSKMTWGALLRQVLSDSSSSVLSVVDEPTRRTLEEMGSFRKKYEEFLRFACLGTPDAEPFYNLQGCDTRGRVDRFCEFIRWHQQFWNLLGESRGRPAKYDDIAPKLRKRYKVLIGWIKAIRTAARAHAKAKEIEWQDVGPSAASLVAKRSNVPDFNFVKSVLGTTNKDSAIAKERLLRESPGISSAQLHKLLYSKMYHRPATSF